MFLAWIDPRVEINFFDDLVPEQKFLQTKNRATGTFFNN